ncbi:MAG: hypothetical protein U1A78_15805 [Polyangia bacterium]
MPARSVERTRRPAPPSVRLEGAARAAGPGALLDRASVPLVLSLCGALLLLLPAHAYRIDESSCSAWPAPLLRLGLSGAYLLAVALLTLGWLGAVRAASTPGSSSSLPRVLAGGLLAHAAALVSPPFLSIDPLGYAAVGRALHTFHADRHAALGSVLPASDPLLSRLPEVWHSGPSAYAAGFNNIAALITRIGTALGDGDGDVALQLRLYQVLSLVVMVLCAALAGVAARTAAQRRSPDGSSPDGSPDTGRLPPEQQGARAAALVLFCPLTFIEGSIGAHNDVFLAAVVGLFALSLTLRRPGLALCALLCGLLIKASALLLVGFFVLAQLGAFVHRRAVPLRPRSLWLLGAALLTVGSGLLWLVLPALARHSHHLVRIVGTPAASVEFCTRSIECVPRAILRWGLQAPTAAWIVNLTFRLLGGLFALYVAYRAARDRRVLSWAAVFLFLYFLCLHSYMQSWYLLSLLPLLPFAPRRYQPAMQTFLVSSILYYAIDRPFDCDLSMVTIGVTEFVQLLLVLVPPLWVLRRSLRAAAAEPDDDEERGAAPESVRAPA